MSMQPITHRISPSNLNVVQRRVLLEDGRMEVGSSEVGQILVAGEVLIHCVANRLPAGAAEDWNPDLALAAVSSGARPK